MGWGREAIRVSGGTHVCRVQPVTVEAGHTSRPSRASQVEVGQPHRCCLLPTGEETEGQDHRAFFALTG